MGSMLESNTTQNVAAAQAAGTGSFAGLLLAIRHAFPDLIPWPVELDVALLAFVASTLGPWLSRVIAFWRNPEKRPEGGNGPPTAWIWLLLLICLILALPGCAGMTPAFGGKTKYVMRFQDIVSEIKDEAGVVVAPGQDTQFSVDIAAPAGVEVTDLASMRYFVNPDTGEVEIAVASETSADTKGQAAMVTEISRQQLEAFRAGMDSALSALAPFIGKYLDARVREGEIRAGVAHDAIETFGAGR